MFCFFRGPQFLGHFDCAAVHLVGRQISSKIHISVQARVDKKLCDQSNRMYQSMVQNHFLIQNRRVRAMTPTEIATALC